MKVKKFTLLTLVILVVGVSAFSLIEKENPRYFPRKTQVERHSSAEAYEEFLRIMTANKESGTVDPVEQLRVKAQMDRMKKPKNVNVSWTFKGPDNVGGRARAIIVDRNDPNHILAGGVAGGLFESFDGATTWQPYDPNFEVNAIACITQDANGDFFIGTGAHFNSPTIDRGPGSSNTSRRNTFTVGSGIYKLTGGGTYERIIGPDTSVNISFGLDYATVGNIAADPNIPGKLYVAANHGFRVIQNMNGNWIDTVPTNISYDEKCLDVNVAPNGNLLVTFKSNSNIADSARVYASTDGMATWSLNKFRCGRIEGAIAPSSPNVMYLSAATTSGTLHNIYRSSDNGDTWQIIGPGGSANFDMFTNTGLARGQGYWDNLLAVLPNDPGRIYVGGVTMYSWQQSSVDPLPPNGSWRRIDVLTDRYDANGFLDPRYVHADKHNMAFDPSNPNIAYIVTDGGVTKSQNISSLQPTYLESNFNFGVTQYYYIGINNNDLAMGGTQDNGTSIVGLKYNTNRAGLRVKGGDGFGTVLSTINPQIGVGSLYYNEFFRIQGIGTTIGNTNISEADIVGNNGIISGICFATSQGCGGPFNTVMGLWESYNHEASRDSAEVTYERKNLPPIPKDTLIQFQGNNNDFIQLGQLANDAYPVDTALGANDTVDVMYQLGSRNRVIANFDTVYFDANAMQIAVVRRGQADTLINYQANNSYRVSNVVSTPMPTQIDVISDTTFRVITPQVTFFYRIKLHDKVQSMFGVANFSGPADNSERNVIVTRDLLKNTPDIRWYNIAGTRSTPDPILNPANGQLNDVLTMEFTKDGNHLFLGTTAGLVYRISGLDTIWNGIQPSNTGLNYYNVQQTFMAGKCKLIGRFTNRSVTDISIDPNNANNVIVTLGNYSNSAYVARTTFALTATDPSSTFEVIMGSGSNRLPNVPAYTAVIDKNDSNRVFIGTDQGIFVTTNAFAPNASNVQWFERNDGIGRIPVFDMHQMAMGTIPVVKADTTFIQDTTFDNNGNIIEVIITEEIDTIEFEIIPGLFDNEGKIYAGTHARGIFETDQFVSVQNFADREEEVSRHFENGLKIYPNPVRDYVKIEFDLATRSDVRIQIYSLNGRLISDEMHSNQSDGKNTLQMNLSDLSNGTYIVRAISGDRTSTSKLLLYK